MVRPSPQRFMCGLVIYAGAAAHMFMLTARHPGYFVAGVAIVAIGLVGGRAVLRDHLEAAGLDRAERAIPGEGSR